MQNRILAFLALGTGLAISAVSGFYSIIGLTTIFAGAFWPIIIMGTVLEIGKLVAVSWLWNNWSVSPFPIRAYFTTAIVILMLITSMGIYGLLSKFHIEQKVAMDTGVGEQISLVNEQIKLRETSIFDIDRQINQINTAIENMTTARASLNAINQQKKTREDLLNRKRSEMQSLSEIRRQGIRLDSEQKKVESEIGPIRYVAELIYGDSDTKIVDKTVRFVIMVIVFVFDPLAIILLIAFNISINRGYIPEFMEMQHKEAEEKPKRKPKIHST